MFKNVIYENASLDQDKFTEIQKKFDPNAKFCNSCNKSICYHNTEYTIIENKIQYKGKTYNLSKTINDTKYYLCLCERCLMEVEPYYLKTKNISRVFNTCNLATQKAFNIPTDVKDKHNKSSVPTLKNLINKYGEEKGTEVFNEYRKKQSYTNTFEYFSKERNWSNEQFIEYNRSRGVTLKNLIKKHGEEKGTEIFNTYCKQQSYTNSKEYFIKKYGEETGLEKFNYFTKHRSHSLENYIERLGEIEGKLQYEKFVNKGKRLYFSKNSQEYFKVIDKHFNNYTTYYALKNKEIAKYSRLLGRKTLIDYFILELNIGIEFNGLYWHADPRKYKPDDILTRSNRKAQDVWDHDKNKIESLKNEHGIDIIIVWEDRLKTIEELNIEISNILKNRKNDK